MTGRYEEPEGRQWQQPGATPAQQSEPAGAGRVDPSASGRHQVAGGPSGPHPVDPTGRPVEQPAPLYADPSSSGQYQVGGGASGPYPVGGGASGPYQVSGGASGPYQVSGGASGPYPVGGGPSGPYPVSGGPSGPHQVAGGPSGPYPVDPHASGPYYVEQHASGPQQAAQPGYYQQGMVQPGATGAPAAQHPQQAARPNQQDLSSSQLIKQGKRPPQSGWRRALYLASGRTINLGESAADLHRRELIARINQPLHGCYKIAMLSLKGGVGKTTTTTTLGSTFSSLRGDRVIAVDANPDRGTLAQKIPLETTATVRHLLRDASRVRKYSDIRAYTSQGPSRLEVLASEQDPAVSEAFSEQDYRRTVELLEHFYNIVLTDCGTGLMHSAMKGVLELADSLVIVSSGSVDGARSASATLDWLDAHGYRELVSRSVAVINSVRPGSGKVDLDKLAQHFAARCRAVCRIPFDPHLEEGAEIELDRLAPATRLALLELAATVADDFPHASARGRAQ
ncbi:MinD-like ATPase involved in chromosome partitioning or flagellar assembly [Streptoalloteichus tenebrarius]|uniref:MinD-like ATPase involved in chromosome partitioning or flagellar assembly n=1 Tax=Streptoalloteichus tenebrarius (strain ATCC 17920 / DSM 40477 / JCM 4838 / CBS 697.72 / NBRC 16177 / NCIMB 11028 / NRRL B-12390 / A12253. 1 / ISP 5477) TaxID=1933 RepID=A0ABT1I1U7_STRSD|nr:AAA family ATPase [Streptoalloteichus tenebrarius]MCP2261739.1 MinD-like ATPase involved in chromosome partitioning or flagellar assembly [Streptoalloteichus tenebrarius]BFF02453.1 MinD/ParA family protein [Streptoalloteichus tenebrarius]